MIFILLEALGHHNESQSSIKQENDLQDIGKLYKQLKGGLLV